MKILISAWEKKCNWEKVTKTLEALGHSTLLYLEELCDKENNPRFRSMFRKFLKDNHIDAIFSISYSPVLARACQETGISYICWCPTLSLEDIPKYVLLYNKNYYFLFDRQAVSNLNQKGIANAFYLPYAPDFPEQIEAYADNLQTKETSVSAYLNGYSDGLVQIKNYLEQYKKNLPKDAFADFQNHYMNMHCLKKRMHDILQIICYDCI